MRSFVCMWILGTCLSCSPSTDRNGSASNRSRQDARELQRYKFEQIQMGVPFKIALYARDKTTANKAATAAFARIAQLNAIMSDYDSNSELMRLCRLSGPGKPVKVSRELQHVLVRSLALSKQTGGAFDVTVGPLTKLWRRAHRQKKLPDPKRLAAARQLVGHRLVRIDQRAGTAELLKQGMRLDLGGIAKGYAADEALAVLRLHGISRALIDGSGDIVVGDPPPGQHGWRIGIAPLKPNGPPSRFVHLKNTSIATSGDAFQYVEIGGKRYSHIIDPKTGLGLTGRSSVTVIAADGITADSLASAVNVLGSKHGLRLIATTKHAAAMIVVIENEQPKRFFSKGWKKLSSNVQDHRVGGPNIVSQRHTKTDCIRAIVAR